jgi:hydroxymethylpyrimidine pyrophosphatase-like HAD family hydrolase
MQGLSRLVAVATQSMVARVLIDAVVTDLDGTLVRADFSLSPATLAALDRIHAAGIRFVVATARTPQGLDYLGVPADRVDIAVCCSGSIGWSPQRRMRLWRDMLVPAAVARVVEIAETDGAGVASFDGAVWRMTVEYARLSPDQPHGTTRVVVDAAALAAAPCCTMAVRHAGGDLTRIASLVASGTGSAALSHVGRSTVLDITREGVDKGTGTLRALAALGVDAGAAIGFGDMPNDLSMFRVTGRSYSVGEVHPDVVCAADEVVADVEHDGFASKIVQLSDAEWRAE